jgi:hypothetical protein
VQAKPLVVIKEFASDLKKGVTLLLNAARAESASLNLPHGVAPDSDHIQDGDLWTTTAGVYVRINGHTVGPLIDAASLLRMTMTVVAGSPPGAGTNVILATPGAGTWTVPSDFPGTGMAEAIGAGGDGGLSDGGGGQGGSGGGGAYASTTFTASPGDVISYQVGVNGGSQGAIIGSPAPGPGTADTWFDSATATLYAQGGSSGGTSIAGIGGSSAGGVAGSSTVTAGGSGAVPGGTGGAGGGGGGGAGGPNGAGADGGSTGHGGTGANGGGGGGANGGTAGTDGNLGATGGQNRNAAGAGIGGTASGVAGAAGADGGGGGGGGYMAQGGAGSMDPIWSDGVNTYGPGGGGGGGGNGFFDPPGFGGNAGGYGGGGGGMGNGLPAQASEGTPGLIAISYAIATIAGGPGHLYSDSDVATVIPADAATSDPTSGSYRPCNCWISADATIGDDVLIYMPGQFVATPGLTPGAAYWLDEGGGVSATPPVTAGALDQLLGWANEDGSKLFFAPERGIGA